MCANHDDPPKVGDSTNPETTSRFVWWMAASSAARGASRSREKEDRSNVTAPYDSRKTSRTSASFTRDSVEFMGGLAATAFDPSSARIATRTWRPYVAVTGFANGTASSLGR